MINFIIYSTAMKHPYEGTVSKLRFCKSFDKNTSALLEQTAYEPLFYTKKIHVRWNSDFCHYLNLAISTYYFLKFFRSLY